MPTEHIQADKVVAALRKHPAVRDAAVMRSVAASGEQLIGYVVASSTDSPVASRLNDEADKAQIAKWLKLFDVQNFARDPGAEFQTKAEKYKPNLAGWKNSYTGKPYPEWEMIEWVDATVQQMLDLRPKRVLEIGAGVGLLLFPVAPTCEAYVATDICEGVIDFLTRHVRADASLDHVKLVHAQASEIDNLPQAYFDEIVLNSVIQYFPSPHYLFDVLKKATRLLRPGGTILVGDVRNLHLLEAFHLTILLNQSSPQSTMEALRTNLRRRVEGDMELAVAPGFFEAIRRQLPGIEQIIVEPRRGRAHNEMSCMRYDILLKMDAAPAATSVAVQNWVAGGWTLDRVREEITRNPQAAVSLSCIPNARSAVIADAVHLVASVEGAMTVAEFRKQLEARPQPAAVDPHDLWDLAKSHPCDVHLSWANSDGSGSFDAAIVPRGAPRPPAITADVPDEPGYWLRLCNDPVRKRRISALTTQLDEFLKSQLPENTLPTRLMVVDQIPEPASA
jgi:SAM-dependent methyltransferase